MGGSVGQNRQPGNQQVLLQGEGLQVWMVSYNPTVMFQYFHNGFVCCRESELHGETCFVIGYDVHDDIGAGNNYMSGG